MTEKDRQVAERFKAIIPRLNDVDKQVFLAYGEGMADKAARMGYDTAPQVQK